MYRFRKSFLPLLSICLLFMFFGVAQLFPATARAQGEITFYDEGPNEDATPGDVLCTLPFVTSQYNFTNMDECKNDQARWYRLTNVPSASRLELWDHPDCDDEHHVDWFYKLKTVKNNFTMEEPQKIEHLATVPNGSIVPGVPGLRLDYKWVAEGAQLKGKLSCVKIINSAGPDN